MSNRTTYNQKKVNQTMLPYVIGPEDDEEEWDEEYEDEEDW
jgi:hypothetical protein